MSTARKRINVRSIGLDDCLFNPHYDTHGSRPVTTRHRAHAPMSGDEYEAPMSSDEYEEWVKLGNTSFIDEVARNITTEGDYDQVFLMVGDERQAKGIDMSRHIAAPHRGNGFVALRALNTLLRKALKQPDADSPRILVNHLQGPTIQVDGYLLADTYGNQPVGENMAKYRNMASYPYSAWLIDTSLVTVVYAQIHKHASEHPEDEIVYDYYSGNATLLQALQDFFLANPDLIPHNVKLRLHHYAGEAITNHPDIQGTGGIDYNYGNNVKLMARSIGIKFPESLVNQPQYQYPEYDFLQNLTEKNLRRFKQQRRIEPPQPSFFQRHKKAILIGAIIGAIVILAVLAVFTFGIAPAVIGGIAAATGLSTGAAIGIGAAAGAVAGAGLGMAGGAAVGAIVDHRAKKGTSTRQTPVVVAATTTTATPSSAPLPPARPSSTAQIARVVISSPVGTTPALAPDAPPPPPLNIDTTEGIRALKDWIDKQETHHKGSIAAACLRFSRAIEQYETSSKQAAIDKQVIAIAYRYYQKTLDQQQMEQELGTLWYTPDAKQVAIAAQKAFAGTGIIAAPTAVLAHYR
ncbi:MAG: hypothetical protein A3E83_05955 [Gammaproteobacteria bacterium RIFCSPHIGHO2_12_FULL_41_20]|nr:MAG: hypothetical protein A3E83_05955 [Gammaproteobacteria bacterium RIFCSPHIGHO2_12_FULL_41_20]